MKDRSSALKFTYKAQSVLLSAQNQGVSPKYEAVLATNLMTFFLLWKVRKYHESYGYAQICSSHIRSHTRHFQSPEQHRNYLNLTGIVVMAVAGCYVKVERNVEKAVRVMENVLADVREWDVPVARIMLEMLGDVQLLRDPSPSSPSPHLPDSDFLATSDYLSLLFITLFIPFITPTTPLIRKTDLEEAMRRESGFKGNRNDEFIRVLSSQGDKYAIVMNSIIASSGINRENSHLTRNKAAERIKKYRKMVFDFDKDWTNSQFGKEKRGRLEQRHDSLPAKNRKFHGNRPGSLTERSLFLQKPKRKKRVLRRRQIMVEFAPKKLIVNTEENTAIDLVPLTVKGRGRRVVLDRTMHIERQADVSISPGARSCLADI